MDSRTRSPLSTLLSRSKSGVMLGAAVMTVAGLSASGCLERGLKPVNPCTRSSVGQRVQVTNVDNVDLLFMIDNSNSMIEEQANLVRELPRLVSVLASGDRDGDGLRDFNPVKSLHVGVVSSDMGAGPNDGVPTCRRGLGDDGILRTTSRSTTAPCMASFPSGIFEFDREAGDDPTLFANTVGCVANIGTGGCGFEQQLEAPLKALTPLAASTWTRPGYTPPLFVSADGVPNTVAGNGQAPGNDGFLRPTSALAVVLVTDEEDCSVLDYNLFVTAESRFAGVPLNVRCNQFGAADMRIVHPVDRYVTGFLGLRSDPGLLIFSGIIGIPPSTEAAAAAGDYTAVLSNPMMAPTVDATGNNLVPSCVTDDGTAYPPVRIVQTAAGLANAGAAVSLASICSSNFQPAIDGIIAKIADALRGACLPRPLNPSADGLVDCEVYELLPVGGTEGVISSCSELGGRTFSRLVVDDLGRERELCAVAQVNRATAMANSAPGWFYDDFNTDLVDTCGSTPQRIAFTTLAPPATGSEVRLECLQTIALGNAGSDVDCNTPGEACRIGQFCSLTRPEGDLCTNGRAMPADASSAALACDPVDRLCGVPCADDAACTTAGLLGYVCDTRTNAVAAGEGVAEIPEGIRENMRGICVNPTCN